MARHRATQLGIETLAMVRCRDKTAAERQLRYGHVLGCYPGLIDLEPGEGAIQGVGEPGSLDSGLEIGTIGGRQLSQVLVQGSGIGTVDVRIARIQRVMRVEIVGDTRVRSKLSRDIEVLNRGGERLAK